MGDEPGRDRAGNWRATLSAIRTQTCWRRVDRARPGSPATAREARFEQPRLRGVLLVQARDAGDGGPTRMLLYQSLVGGSSRESPFIDVLRARYRALVERYGTPGVDVPAEPPTVAVATVEPDHTPAQRRRIARELERIALDVATLHDRLYQTIITETDHR